MAGLGEMRRQPWPQAGPPAVRVGVEPGAAGASLAVEVVDQPVDDRLGTVRDPRTALGFHGSGRLLADLARQGQRQFVHQLQGGAG